MGYSYAPETRSAAVAAFSATGGSNVSLVAGAYGISVSTVRRWISEAGVPILPTVERERLGQLHAPDIRWPGWQKRRAKARKLRAKGYTLAEIRDACGYRSLASAHYATLGVLPLSTRAAPASRAGAGGSKARRP